MIIGRTFKETERKQDIDPSDIFKAWSPHVWNDKHLDV